MLNINPTNLTVLKLIITNRIKKKKHVSRAVMDILDHITKKPIKEDCRIAAIDVKY